MIAHLLKIADDIADDLEAVRRLIDQQLASPIGAVTDLVDDVRRFPGKMLRPILVLLSGRAVGKLTPDHTRLAAAAEMAHLASLIHDDIIDQAETRRRHPTIHHRHDIETAIVFGDYVLCRAFRLCAAMDHPTAGHTMADTASRVCEGELMQLYARGYPGVDETAYLAMIQRKTARLIAQCCYQGAILAHADETTSRAMEAFGLAFGTAYQLIDDIHDWSPPFPITIEPSDNPSSEPTEKSHATDWLTRTLTLPMIHHLAQLPPDQRDTVLDNVTHPRVELMAEMTRQLEASGSFEYARQRARAELQHARAALPESIDPAMKRTLSYITDGLLV